MSATVATPVLGSTPGIASASNVFYFLLVPAMILWYAYWKISRKHLEELAAKLPGPPGYPLIGNALDFSGTSHIIFNHMIEKSKEFGKIIRMWIGHKLFVFLMHPDDVELILGSHEHIDKAPEYRFFKPWLGDGLLISTGPKWRAHRKLIAPAFHLNVLKSFIDLFNTNSLDVVNRLKKTMGKEIDCHDYMSEATVEILLETAMGVSKKTQDQSGYDYAMAVMKMCDILHLRHTKMWLYPDVLFNLSKYKSYQDKLINTIHSLTRKVIKSKKAAFAKGIRGSIAEVPENLKSKSVDNTEVKTVVEGLSFGQSAGLKDDLDVDDDIGEKKRMAFLDLMIEASQSGVVINDEEIKEQVDTIMFEGHDTTAAGSSFFLCMMGLHTDIQDKVYEELNEIFKGSDRPATFADTLEMKYLERCLMETLRMYPPVPLIARQLRRDLKLTSEDLTVPAGCTVIIPTFKIHRDPVTYPNPEKFDPDNFLPERTANRHYYSFIPFSAGPRSCVGRKYAMLKLKILLSHLLRNFRIVSDVPEADYKLQADIILKREDGFRIKLEPRKKVAA
ncbi:cytochrome P450 4g15-like [Harmonia axyridis]|uniref:cytochrome P450 4g15-like n=1 Tax=Harmonia axyridis TaxID=115357 RepID=UPI001E276C58|nr:cytochrome P450 4g15-like [Harmonia axyridis]